MKVVVGMSGGVDSSVAALLAEARRARGRRPLHEELGGRRRRRVLLDARGPGRRRGRRRRHRHRARGGELLRRVQGPRVRRVPARVRRRAARRTPTCCATPRSSSRPSSTTPCAWAPRRSRPGTTREWVSEGRCSPSEGKRRDQGPELFPASPDAGAALARDVSGRRAEEDRGAADRARGRACRTTPRRTRPASASSASGRSASSSTATCRRSRGRSSTKRASRSASTSASRSTRSASARASASAGRAKPGTWRRSASATNELVVVQGHDHPLLHEDGAGGGGHELDLRHARRQRRRRTSAKTRYRQADAPCTLARVARQRDPGRFRQRRSGR